MKNKITSVTLGKHFEQIITKSIQSGRYDSAKEVIRAGLRYIEEEEQKIAVLKKTIEAGENSGYVENFDPVKHLEELNSKYANEVGI